MPEAVGPVQWAVEVGGGEERLVLPVEEYVEQVEVTVCPVCSVEVVVCVDVHKVVEVYLVSSLILVVCEVKLVRHLV